MNAAKRRGWVARSKATTITAPAQRVAKPTLPAQPPGHRSGSQNSWWSRLLQLTTEPAKAATGPIYPLGPNPNEARCLALARYAVAQPMGTAPARSSAPRNPAGADLVGFAPCGMSTLMDPALLRATAGLAELGVVIACSIATGMQPAVLRDTLSAAALGRCVLDHN